MRTAGDAGRTDGRDDCGRTATAFTQATVEIYSRHGEAVFCPWRPRHAVIHHAPRYETTCTHATKNAWPRLQGWRSSLGNRRVSRNASHPRGSECAIRESEAQSRVLG